MPLEHITLTTDRSKLTARESIDAITRHARQQDSKIYIRKMRVIRSGFLLNALIFTPPACYAFYQMTAGYWRQIYPTHTFSSFLQGTQGRIREYFVPQMYLKEREKRKLEVKLKDTQQLREAWKDRS